MVHKIIIRFGLSFISLQIFMWIVRALRRTEPYPYHCFTMISSVPTAAIHIFSIILLFQNQVLCATWTVQWEHKNNVVNECENRINGICPLELHMNEQATVNVTISDLDGSANRTIRLISVSELDVLNVPKEIQIHNIGGKKWHGSFVVDAEFIGKASVHVEIGEEKQSDNEMFVIITRAKRVIDTVFIVSVASLVSILYINFGAALDLKKVKGVLRRPIGPVIAFLCHFIVLPLVRFGRFFTFNSYFIQRGFKILFLQYFIQASYGLGLLLFPNNPAMRLGLFFTGSSPAGGASNTWTVIFNGRIWCYKQCFQWGFDLVYEFHVN